MVKHTRIVAKNIEVYLDAAETETKKEFLNTLLEEAIDEILDDVCNYMKNFWLDKLEIIDYTGRFYIRFQTDSFKQICRRSDGNSNQKRVIQVFEEFLEAFREDLFVQEGEAWKILNDNWPGN